VALLFRDAPFSAREYPCLTSVSEGLTFMMCNLVLLVHAQRYELALYDRFIGRIDVKL
jgi:hypothetical protein